MKLPIQSRWSKARNRAGWSLMECAVYMAVFFLVFNLALMAYYKFTGYSRDFRRNAADVLRAVEAGEHWRAEVRTATEVTVLPAGEAGVRMKTAKGEVRYVLDAGTLWRDDGGQAGRQPYLKDVRRSEFVMDARAKVKAWRWEVELQSPKSAVRVRPLFSFTAVMDGDFKP